MQNLSLFGRKMLRIEGTAVRMLIRSTVCHSSSLTFCSRISGIGYCHVPHTVTLQSQRCLSSSGAAQQHAPLRNEQIKYPSMRVVFKDPVTGTSAWKIMDRKDALDFAKSQSLDLILGMYVSNDIVHCSYSYSYMFFEQLSVSFLIIRIVFL